MNSCMRRSAWRYSQRVFYVCCFASTAVIVANTEEVCNLCFWLLKLAM